MIMKKQEAIAILWDFLQMHEKIERADLIIGFGCYNEDVARRCAQLYLENAAPRILFTGGLGRNTRQMWQESEAERFSRIAVSERVPRQNILIEKESTNFR